MEKIRPPDYLTGAKQVEKFEHYAQMLSEAGIFSELDADCLARYIMSEQLYLQYTNMLVKLTRNNDLAELSRVQSLQDKAFKQCQKCAKDLGLSDLM